MSFQFGDVSHLLFSISARFITFVGLCPNDHMKSNKQTRRLFLRQSAVATAGLLLAPHFRLSGFPSPSQKSLVIVAHSDRVIDQDGSVDPDVLQEMIDLSILRLTAKKHLKAAWGKYFSTEDIIGMKVNGNSYSALQGTPMTAHFPLLTRGILNSLRQADIDEKHAIIWERSDQELADMGYVINKDMGSLRIMGTHKERRASETGNGDYQPWFSTINRQAGSKVTHLSNILEQECTALINLPCLKSHRLAGVTGALKNHYGSIDNPRDFHENNCCSPGAAEINNIPVIREKHRLVICNALMGLWAGGPRWNQANMWMEGSLIFGEDPVAVDTVMLQMIDVKRQEAGLPPVSPMAQHIRLSEELGLGQSSPENIEQVVIEV